ncbi:MAG TPA: choice-of-anchor D domain-containing protein [Myxococcales bacterium]|nr:choice-of-anchor D domain-containing protein [Myxococcales bacterium]
MTYAPSAPGPSSAFLPYTPCTDCEPQAIALSGTGVDGNLVFTPSPIEFGNVPEGSTATMVVTATNLGTEPLTVTSFGVSADGNAFALSELPALPLALAPQQSATFTVSYSPSGSAGGDSGTLLANWTVADPAVGNRQANDDLSGL